MTAHSITPPAVAVRAGAKSGWLYGPAIDLLLGAGVVYLVTLPLLIGLDLRGQMTAWSITAATMLSLFISGPHYGATILRVYDRREDRRQYALFAIWATAALAGLFVVGLHWVLLGSILVTAYATWTPWHFSGQNYGVALMFLRRRGIQVDPRTRHFLYASFVTSFLLSIAVMHSVASTVAAAPTWMQGASEYRFLSLGIPQTATRLAVWASALAYLVSLVGAGVLLLRRARAIDLLPVACIALMQSAWFALPAALPIMVHVRLGGPAFDALWLSAAHSTQYLWVTSFYASQEQRAQKGPEQRDLALRSWWVRTLLAGSMVTTFPAIVFAPGVLGTFAWDNGLSMLLVSVVNLHHFVLDGAIWKLRDGRVARLLLRDVRAGSESASGPAPRIRWGRSIVAAVGTVSLAVALFDYWQREMVINRAGEDLEAIERSTQRLAWIGRDAADVHTYLAGKWVERGRLDEAIAEYQRSLAIHENPDARLVLRGLESAAALAAGASAPAAEPVSPAVD